MQNDKSPGNNESTKEFYETVLEWAEGNLCRFCIKS